ncbi:hypothetical protein [uncultured Hoeflea sp.]|uniref:hypothetical protein n=1 Tax=uncultured Hoeflea sp. TaxID=538666 RepID=UPI00261F3DB6|nr:hypothetical protein [uncultured Hoeflea sp.]
MAVWLQMVPVYVPASKSKFACPASAVLRRFVGNQRRDRFVPRIAILRARLIAAMHMKNTPRRGLSSGVRTGLAYGKLVFALSIVTPLAERTRIVCS